jgi:RimJ/RimL family protein N-acetyltransferase
MAAEVPMRLKKDPILLDFPDEFESERLVIRALRPGDGPAINAAIIESLAHLRPWMPWAQGPQSIDDTEAFVRGAASEWAARTNLTLGLWRKADGLYVGGSGLHRIDWDVPRFEIGYWVRASLQGQGYITEAVECTTRFAFETLLAQRIEIRCDASNGRSSAVARRCGFTQEAHLRSESRGPDGGLRDTLIFAMLAGEWALSRPEGGDR